MGDQNNSIRILRISWEKAVELSQGLANRVKASGYLPDLIIAVSRGGLVPARIISDVLGIDDIIAIMIKYWGAARRRHDRPLIYHGVEPSIVRGRRVLIVDEVSDTGKTLETAVSFVSMAGPMDVKTAVLHLKSTSSFVPDFYMERLEDWVWISYPWSTCEDYREFKAMGLEEYGGDLCE